MDGSDGDEFGRSVAVGPSRVIVGPRFADSTAIEDTGAVYIYDLGGRRPFLNGH